ncbi:hypothetical protein [Terriglobus aquaticus]|uniref:Lipoprotein n=1 Tax=Terriglobus aquaticus TaxID=940139 RepID=A0ABW9KG62_9BACT|nr:hypothetical protein [Terriglobus aquaticus]
MRIVKTMVAVALTAVLVTGCNKKKDESGNLKTAINDFYDAHPECLFATEKKFPVQADTKNSSDTAPWDALVDQGLLTRTTAEKTKLIVLSKSVNNYDLSDKGRGTWKADPNQPGYGNFCYGKRVVETVVSHTPVAGTQPGVSTVVNYTYTIGNVADWARAAVVQTAYPDVKAKLASANNAQDTLVLTNNGWQVQSSGTSSRSNPKTAADGSIVQ